MPKTPGTYVNGENESYITVFIPDHSVPLIAASSHPNWDEILKLYLDDSLEHPSPELFDPTVEISKKFEKLSRRVAVADGKIYFDGDELDNSLTAQILRFKNEGVDDWRPLVNFFEKVADNPQEHSRKQLYNWLSKHDFAIHPSGDIIAYKGCQRDSEGKIVSINSGPGIVDGVSMNGHLPNEVGSVVEISRSLVHHDPAVGCSTGLHVGTFEYAKNFAKGVLLEVHVNPADIVSVPTDCGWAKVRTCRYTVVSTTEVEYTVPVVDDNDWDWDDDWNWEDKFNPDDGLDDVFDDDFDYPEEEEPNLDFPKEWKKRKEQVNPFQTQIRWF